MFSGDGEIRVGFVTPTHSWAIFGAFFPHLPFQKLGLNEINY